MIQNIVFLKGDATCPSQQGVKIIAHICNDIGGWGKGFVLALSKKWKQPEAEYRKWFKEGENFKLGEVQFVQAQEDIFIANMIGQHDIKRGANGPPIRYEAVNECLNKLGLKALEINASVHIPRIGCGLAGGKWENIEPLIISNLTERGIPVYVYDFE
ncbi:macro domain-containing protein [Pseudobacteroides cellulosolvens]|uniref:Appr-1-p processing domain protein n=1 Tax=Pseudobacteroides cellulosolvens ATCC 35603 = DSM 2933 TaxID=398512 RepID=A0A0L6JM76_9FIRM|nr:macro domain-containing protein [Pseudobacteroides cellulosolvens]KNY26901.1 Appr-1-p processing domain protein [Pseudobacteroides cellulosolvens ATCC 35603 = DSM 2933]